MFIKKLLKNKSVYFAVLSLALFFFVSQSASAASLYLTSNKTTLAPGETVTLYVIVNSDGVSINNAEASIKFPTDLLDVISVSKSGSIFSLWVEDPAYSNSTGVISFNGGLPTPGYTGARGSIISIFAKAKKAGTATFSLAGAAVRANDGLGTNVLTGQSGKTLTITAKEEPAKVVEPVPTPEAKPIVAPIPSEAEVKAEPKKEDPIVKEVKLNDTNLIISSLTHPSQESWSTNSSPVFKWNLPADMDAVQLGIGINNSDEPSVIYKPAINEKAVGNLGDGVWYFKVRAHQNNIWGPISTYVVRIDTASPVQKNVVFNYNDDNKNLTITTDAQDNGSGIKQYELFINNNLVKTIPAEEFVDGNYSLPVNVTGENKVKLITVDGAGNRIEAEGALYSLALPTPQLKEMISVLAAGEPLVIRGTIQKADLEIVIKIKNEQGEIINLATKSYADLSFFALAPNLPVGNYEIWAETGADARLVASSHAKVAVASGLLITIGSVTMNAWPFFSLILFIVLALLALAFYLGYRFRKPQLVQTGIASVTAKRDNLRMMQFLKKRLEKHLDLIQATRHQRLLTKAEKELKLSIEAELDQVDKAIVKQKKL